MINAKNNQAYAAAVERIAHVRQLLMAADLQAGFPAYTAKLRATHKPKRNLMKLFDQRGW